MHSIPGWSIACIVVGLLVAALNAGSYKERAGYWFAGACILVGLFAWWLG